MPTEFESAPLENDHNVYILGAGFSRAAGFPLVHDFLLQMRNVRPQLDADGRADEVKAIDRVLRFALDAASAAYRIPFDPENIEELFSLASSSGDESLTQAFTIAIASTLQVRHAVPRLKVSFTYEGVWFEKLRAAGWIAADQSSGAIGLYEWMLAALLNVPIHDQPPRRPGRDGVKNTLITFNYDVLVERALMALGVQFDRVVTEARPGALQLIKLHGSIDWMFDERNQVQVRSLDDARGKPVVIVPPTWRKAFLDTFSKLWDEAVRALATATRVVIIGYSVPKTDQHFKYMLAEGLRRNVSLRNVVVVNPSCRRDNPVPGLFRPEFVAKGYVAGAPMGAENFSGYPVGLETIGRPIPGGYVMTLPASLW